MLKLNNDSKGNIHLGNDNLGVKKPAPETIMSSKKEDRIFLISDTHFGHTGIVQMCNRPFRNMRKMNRYMIRQWNRIVKQDDTVYFLGDIKFGKRGKSTSFWTSQLNGEIVMIEGNHDKQKGNDYQIVNWSGKEFLLYHYPYREKLPIKCDGWLVHGHVHNNDMVNFPFINGDKKTINVSVELIDYVPLKVSKLLSLGIDSIKRMATISSIPELK